MTDITIEEAVKILEWIMNSRLIQFPEGLKALHMAIDVLEKQIPKKPEIHMETIYNDDEVCDIINCFTCPMCNNSVAWFHKYCDNCGQALDWSKVDDEYI